MSTIVAERLKSLWRSLYASNSNYTQSESLLNDFINKIDTARDAIIRQKSRQPQHAEDEPKDELFHVKSEDWYQKAVVYCLYVDLFNGDFAGLEDKLVYLQQLGVTCLWLLPILESPMKDCGFDISNYKQIRNELLPPGVRESKVEDQFVFFRKFMAKAHSLGINVLIDIALNHTSEENEWFVREKAHKQQGAAIDPETDFYIWSPETTGYDQCRIIFSDVCSSNWEPVYGEGTDPMHYFHRFLPNQPDLNYKNPQVLLEIASAFVFWLQQGCDAFRMDAIPMLWKEEGTGCESLPQVHTVLKFFRTVIDHVSPHTAILAEACQQPKQVVKYFGQDDECHAAYHFPLIPRLFHSFAIQDKAPVQQILSKDVTPDIPSHCAWFLFLRCHDELTLEMVPESERREIFNFYCQDERFQFRQHSGVSARLADLCRMNPEWIKMAHSLLLTIIGTPILFYGDEFAMQNDEEYYEEALVVSGGIHDSRNYNRGRLNTKWNKFEEEIKKENSLSAIVHHDLKNKLRVRKQFEFLGKTADVRILDCNNLEGNPMNNILAYERVYNDEGLLCVHNLSDKPCSVVLPYHFGVEKDLLDQQLQVDKGNMTLQPYGHTWLRLDRKTNCIV